MFIIVLILSFGENPTRIHPRRETCKNEIKIEVKTALRSALVYILYSVYIPYNSTIHNVYMQFNRIIQVRDIYSIVYVL